MSHLRAQNLGKHLGSHFATIPLKLSLLYTSIISFPFLGVCLLLLWLNFRPRNSEPASTHCCKAVFSSCQIRVNSVPTAHKQEAKGPLPSGNAVGPSAAQSTVSAFTAEAAAQPTPVSSPHTAPSPDPGESCLHVPAPARLAPTYWYQLQIRPVILHTLGKDGWSTEGHTPVIPHSTCETSTKLFQLTRNNVRW